MKRGKNISEAHVVIDEHRRVIVTRKTDGSGFRLYFYNGEKETAIPVSEEAGAALAGCLYVMFEESHRFPSVSVLEKEADHG